MQKIEIKNITKADIFKDARRTVEYIGQRGTEGTADYERLLIEKENEEQLERFWEEGLTMLEEVLSRNLESGNLVTEDGTALDIELSMTDNWEDRGKRQLEKAIKSYLTAMVTSGWLRIVKHDGAEGYNNDAASWIVEIEIVLSRRKRAQHMHHRGHCHKNVSSEEDQEL